MKKIHIANLYIFMLSKRLRQKTLSGEEFPESAYEGSDSEDSKISPSTCLKGKCLKGGLFNII